MTSPTREPIFPARINIYPGVSRLVSSLIKKFSSEEKLISSKDISPAFLENALLLRGKLALAARNLLWSRELCVLS
jgi:hypothetical protein